MVRLNPHFTLEWFQEETKNHQIIVHHNDGLYRHIGFRMPSSGTYSFNLITWPGHLCYCGDMGEYVFSHLPDMFEFFRSDRDKPNYGYWAQKVLAEDRHDGVKGFTYEAFRETVLDICKQQREGLIDDEGLEEGERNEQLDHYDDWVRTIEAQLDECSDMTHESQANDLLDRWIEDKEGCLYAMVFEQFWSYHSPIEEFSLRFMWCCNAIVYGIKKYDEWVKKYK